MKSRSILFLCPALMLASCAVFLEQRDYSYLKKYSDIKNYERFCANYPKSKHYAEVNGKLQGLYEQRDWNATLQKNDIEAYAGFIAKYPQSSYVAEAGKKLNVLYEERDYKNAVSSDSISVLKSFLTHYPLSDRKEEVEKLVLKLQEEQDWGNTCTMDNIPAYKDFLLRYPQSEHRFDANARITMIPEWEQVKKENNEHAYKRFIVRHPYCKYADDARAALAVYDNAYWKKALDQNTSGAYKDYLENYPDGIHAKVAKKKIIDLKVDNIFSGSYESLPSLTHNNGGYFSKESIVSIKNDSPYSLTVYYSGTDTKEVEIEPKGVMELRIANGTYRVAATANVMSVKNYAGTEILEGSVYEVVFYISQKR